jgi:hypothetical protein
MHPDAWRVLIAMVKAFLLTSIAIYSFNLGRLFYEYVNLNPQ